MSRQKIQRCKAPDDRCGSLTQLSELLPDDAAMLIRCDEFSRPVLLPGVRAIAEQAPLAHRSLHHFVIS
jgi:hypothetical protein